MMFSRLPLWSLLLASVAFAASPGGQTTPARQASPENAPAKAAATAKQVPPPTSAQTGPALDARAQGYYHFQLAQVYEGQAELNGRSDDLNRALEEYRKAMHADPKSAFIPVQMADLLFRAGQTGDAIRLAQSVEREHPNDEGVHRLLGQIYIHLLGNGGGVNADHGSELLRLAVTEYQALTRLAPDDSDAHMTLGRLLRASNRPADAQREYSLALKQDRTSEEAVSSLMSLYADQQDFAAAQKLFNEVPEDARTAKMYGALGYVYDRKKDFRSAADAYAKAAELDDENVDYRRSLAQSLFLTGELQKALAQYKSIADADPQDPQAYLRMSQIHRQMGQYQQAEAEIAKAAQLAPDSPEIAYYQALLFESEGKLQKASDTLRDLVKRTVRPDGKYTGSDASNRGVFLEKLGELERKQGDFAGALQAFSQMATLDSENQGRAYEEIAETYRTQHQYARAAAAAAEGLQKQPNNHALRGVYASLLADSGQVDQGIQQLRNMLKGTPDDFDIYMLIGQVNQRARRWNDAQQAASKAESLATSNAQRASAEFLMGGNYERQKKYDDAERTFKHALTLDPGNPLILNYLGYMLADRGVRLQEALGYVQRALRTEAQNGSFLDSLGWVYFKLNRLDEAATNLQRAADMERDDPVILDHLAEVNFRIGHLRDAEVNWTRALAAWQTAAPGDSDPAEMAKVRKKLDDLRTRLAHIDSGQEQQ